MLSVISRYNWSYTVDQLNKLEWKGALIGVSLRALQRAGRPSHLPLVSATKTLNFSTLSSRLTAYVFLVPADGAPVLSRCPKELEQFLRHHTTGRNSRPDAITLRKGADGTETILIIEFKYCKDTKPEDQLEKCMTQHSSLISQLRAAGYKVELVPVLIGHSGTIYTSHTLDNMKQLGISTVHTMPESVP